MELVEFDVDLLLNERQVACTRNSISKMKKRLHDTQLTLILEPPENEPAEIYEWKAKVHELINRREKLDFPTMRMILKEKRDEDALTSPLLKPPDEKINNPPHSRSTNKRSSVTQEQIWERMKKAELRKRLATDCKAFGANQEGEVLRTIENYQGLNSVHPTSRTLVRKTHIRGPFDNTSSVPASIGPGQYDITNNIPLKPGGDIGYQIAFKAVPRDKLVNAGVLRNTAISRNLKSPYREDDSKYFLRKSDISAQHSLLDASSGFHESDYDWKLGTDSFSTSDFLIDPDETAIRSLVRSAKIGKGHKYDTKNSCQYDFSLQLKGLVAKFEKSDCFKEFEVRDYTLGALTALNQKSDDVMDPDESFVPERNSSTSDSNFRSERRQSFRNGTAGKKCCGDNGSLKLGGSSVLSATTSSQQFKQLASSTMPLSQPKTRKISKGSERLYSFLTTNKKLSPNMRNKNNIKSSISRGPLFSRENTKIVKRVYFPLKKPSVNNLRLFTPNSSLGDIHCSDDTNSNSNSPLDNFEIILDSIDSPHLIKFPPLEVDLRPTLDKWYIENNLYSPSQPKSIIRQRLPEFIPSPCMSPLANTIALAAFKEDRKGATFSPAGTLHKKNSVHTISSLTSSTVDMNGILLPQITLENAISTQIFSSTNEFHQFIKDYKIEGDKISQ